MLFNSFEFLLFFPLVTIIYFMLPHKFRWFHLLLASCVFYMAFIPVYILILFFTIIIDYIAGILIENANGARRKMFLVMSLVANIGVLAYFKYYNFFVENIIAAFQHYHVHVNLSLLHFVLPIGLSFHTFQAMSYTIEVYRGNHKPERHFGIYALYVMFYPQLAAGPIERPQNILYQFHEEKKFDYSNVVIGLRMMLWGLFKKIVIADNLALFADPVLNDPHKYPGTTIAVAIVFFAFQIYCDFSGYSEVALGTARVMGFKLLTNFNHPYHARSITEFWRRWHISLSTWFSDYLHGPVSMALRNYGMAAVIGSAIFTFLISGLWHGADWKFVIWGGLHGLAIGYEILTKKTRKEIFKKLPQQFVHYFTLLCTFTYVCFVYVFFRASTTADAFYMIRKFGAIPGELLSMLKAKNLHALAIASPLQIVYGVALISILEIYYLVDKKYKSKHIFIGLPRYAKWAIYYAVILGMIFLGVSENKQFIYFQF